MVKTREQTHSIHPDPGGAAASLWCRDPGSGRAAGARTARRHQPVALQRLVGATLRPAGQPVVEDVARGRVHRPCPASQRDGVDPRRRSRDHEPRRPRHGAGGRADGRRDARRCRAAAPAGPRLRTPYVAFLGVTSYRVAFGRPRAVVGRQPDTFESAVVWVLPNPSGLNAHYQQPALSAAYRDLRLAAERCK